MQWGETQEFKEVDSSKVNELLDTLFSKKSAPLILSELIPRCCNSLLQCFKLPALRGGRDTFAS